MEPTSEQTDPERDRRILWVEGYLDNREFLAVFLGMAGYAVTSCDSVGQAANIIEDRHFDIYIVGDCLPFRSSLPLAAQINALNPQAPLILYSALAYAGDIEQGFQAGAHAYITKPGNLDHLLATIRRLVGGKHRASSGSGSKAERICGRPVPDQPSRTAEVNRETEIPGRERPSSEHYSIRRTDEKARALRQRDRLANLERSTRTDHSVEPNPAVIGAAMGVPIWRLSPRLKGDHFVQRRGEYEDPLR